MPAGQEGIRCLRWLSPAPAAWILIREIVSSDLQIKYLVALAFPRSKCELSLVSESMRKMLVTQKSRIECPCLRTGEVEEEKW
jgi:hypothetical protein